MTGRPTDLVLRVERVLPAPRALIFKLHSEPDADDRETVVDFALRVVGEATKVGVDQGPFLTEVRRAVHTQGWEESLDRLFELVVNEHPLET
jgi:hypothetical protein